MIHRNLWKDALLNAPSIESELCPLCNHMSMATNRHHIVPKGLGGTSYKEGPTICVCGMGNTSGCHKRLHDGKVHLRYVGAANPHWEFVEFEKETSLGVVIRDEDELDWKPVIALDRYEQPMRGKAMLNG